MSISLETIKSLAQWVGIPFLVLLAIFLVATTYPKLRVIFGDCLALFAWIGRWFQRRSLESEFEGSVNTLASTINSEFTEPILPQCHIRWVTPSNSRVIASQGHVIVKLSLGEDHGLNMFNATYRYVKAGLIPIAKPYLRPATANAINLLTTHLLLRKSARTAALTVFNQKFRQEEDECREVFGRLEEIEDAGLFMRVLVQEYESFGTKIGTHVPSLEIENETEEFLDWIHTLAVRLSGEKSILAFSGKHIRVGMILVASEETYEKFGIDPYVRRANYYASSDFTTVFLMSRGRRNALTKRIAQELIATGGFEVLTKKPDLVRVGHDGTSIIITCIPLRLDYVTIIERAWTRLNEAYDKNEKVLVFVQQVDMKEIIVDAYGIKTIIPLTRLTRLNVLDARKYFEPQKEIEVEILECDPAANRLELSNIGTTSDPQRIVDLQRAHGDQAKAMIEGYSLVDGFEIGLRLRLTDTDASGFVPRYLATRSRFTKLSDKYRISDLVDVKVIDFNPVYGTFTCQIANLTNPWDPVTLPQEGQVVEVTVREITEEYLTCETGDGLEGRVFREEIAWGGSDAIRKALTTIVVGYTTRAAVLSLDRVKRRIRFSLRRTAESPCFRYATDNLKQIVGARVTAFAPYGGIVAQTIPSNYAAYIPMSEISWGFCEDPSIHVKIHEEVKAQLIGYNDHYDSVVLSLKSAVQNDYQEARGSLQIGDTVQGVIRRVCKDHCLVEVFHNSRVVQAYVHKSEISNMLFVEESNISHLLQTGKIYHFLVKRLDDRRMIAEISRKQYLRNHLVDIRYGKDYDVRFVGVINRTAFFYADAVEGSAPAANVPEANIGNEFSASIERKDERTLVVELQIHN